MKTSGWFVSEPKSSASTFSSDWESIRQRAACLSVPIERYPLFVGSEMEPSTSVFDLLTELSKAIVAEHVPDPVLPAKLKNGYKKLRSKAYEIILKKVPVIEDIRKKIPNDEFEFINDPLSELLLLATPNCLNDPTVRQIKLQNGLDQLRRTGASEDPTIRKVLEMFIYLIDELPSDQIPVKPNRFGFINTDGYYVPTVRNSDGVIPYKEIPREILDPEPLRRLLKEGLGSGYKYKILPADIFEKERDFGAAVSRMIKEKTKPMTSKKSISSMGESSSQTIRCHRSCMPEDQRPDSEMLGPAGHWDWDWDEELSSNRRTWEHLGDPNPPKCKRWLLDGLEDGTSMVHDLLLIAGENLNVIDTPEFFRCLKYLLLGIGSHVFPFDQTTGTFRLCDGGCVYGRSPGSVREMIADSAACGAMAHRLTQMSKDPPRERGQMYAALCACVRRFLLYHHAAVMLISDDATLLEVTMKTAPELKWLLHCMSRLCDVIDESSEARGSRLLTRVYDYAMQHATERRQAFMLLSVLDSCVTLYLRWLEYWLFHGELQAPRGEFFIEQQPEFTSCRARPYWKKAFCFGTRLPEAPGFLKGLEVAILETGRGVNLLRLCNPNHPLLGVMASRGRPKLSFVTNSVDLKPVEAAFEAYYQTALAATSPPVSIGQLLEQSTEAEIALQARVQQVFEMRMAAHALAQRDAAAERAADQAAQMDAWRTQIRLRSEHKARAAERERRLDEELARQEAVVRQREDARHEEARQELVSHYESALKAVDARKRLLLDEIVAESQFTATESQPAALQTASPSEAGSTTPSDISDSKPSPLYEGLPSPNANSNLGNREVVDNNRFNLAEDQRNQNAECDNLIVDSTNATKRKASLTLDLQRTATDNRNRVLGADDALTKPWGTIEREVAKTQGQLSPEEYSRLAALGSRKASAERIRERIAGVSQSPNIWPENRNTNESARRRSSLTLELQLVAAANRTKILGADDALTKPWADNMQPMPKSQSQELSPDEYNRLAAFGSRKASAERIKQRICGVSQLPNIRLETPERKVPTVEEIKRNMLKTEFGIDGDSPSEGFQGRDKSKDSDTLSAPSNSIGMRLDSILPEQMEISPSENPSVKVEYFREVSNVSTAYGGLTPGTAMTDSDADLLFVSSRPSLARAYSYGPCSRYDQEWQERLAKGPSAGAKLLTPSYEAASNPKTITELDGDIDTVNRILKRMMIIPVRTQMKLVNDALLSHFLVDADLLMHLQSLRDYFFLLDGEFGQTVTVLLFQRLEKGTDPENLICPAILSDILCQALAATIDGDNVNARRLSFEAVNVPRRFRLADPDTLSCINLRYQVGWPLNILITPKVIENYQIVFSFLLKLRRCSWVMNELFLTMKRLAADRELCNSPQFCKAQLIRHVMTHMLYGLHNYVTSTVLNESWRDLQHTLKQSTTLEEIYYNHVTYIKMVLLRCLLAVKGKPEQFQKHLTNIFLLVLKFQGHLTYGGTWTKNPKSGHYEHSRFEDILKVYRLYQEQTASLVRLSKKLAEGQYSHLFELMQKLSMNDFYEPKV